MKIQRIATIAALAMLWGCTGFAAEPPDTGAAAKQAREQMALHHEKMAACLRSDRPLAECRNEMMRDCRAMKQDGPAHKCGMGQMDGAPQDQKSEHSDHQH